MTGKSLNTKRKGQILLIAVMLIATVITVVMTIAFNTTSETQLSKLEEDSKKALAAADAGIEAALKQAGTVNIASLGSFSTEGITGNATVETTAKNYFISPLLQNNEQYTFYLSDYPGLTNPWSGNLHIVFSSETGKCASISVTVIQLNGAQTQYTYNTSCSTVINGANIALATVTKLDDTTFQYATGDIAIANSSLMLVHIYGAETRLGWQSASVLPIQGRTVISEARTKSGVVKRVELFQSYPQIPASFFTASF